jgi:DNA-binding MarR family transcriptional regulator
MALTELAAGAPLTQQQLAERLGLEKSTVSRLIAGLERRSLVRRRRDPDNRRFAQVSLTEHGRTVTHRMGNAMLERHGHIFAAMTAAERDALTVGLTALVRAMNQAPPMGQ